MSDKYDAIVVGARCAGSPTAMLLARRGYKVLLIDKATFPSDTLSTHFIHIAGTAALQRWGLLDRVAASGCPPVESYRFDFGPIVIAGKPRAIDDVDRCYAPRRTVLDEILVNAAVEAGAESRLGVGVDELVFEDGRVAGVRGRGFLARAPIVIGADGLHSLVARAVEAPKYHERPKLEAGYYAYWSGVPTDGFEIFNRPYRSWAAIPTNDGLTCVVATWPMAEFAANRADIEGNFWRTLELSPDFAARVRAGRRETRIVGTGDLPNFYRTPFGTGWALVGDAGYHKDPGTAQGISDAFRDAELLVEAIDAWARRGQPYADAMTTYQQARDEQTLPMFDLTCQIASLEPPSSDFVELLGAVARDQSAMDDFVSMISGSLPVADFFAPENVQRITGQRVAAR